MNETSYNVAENILLANNILINEKLKTINYDKTEICSIIVSNQNEDPNCYWVSNEAGVKYLAYTTDNEKKYLTGSKVYVLIPLGNYELKKIIIGSYVGEEKVSTSNLNDYYWVDIYKANNLLAGTSLIAEPDYSNLIELYDTLCILVAYNTTPINENDGNFSEKFYFGNKNLTIKKIEEENVGERKIIEENLTEKLFISEDYDPFVFTLYNPEKIKEAMYDFVKTFTINKDFVFDLNGDGVVDNRDVKYLLSYTISPLDYPISDTVLDYLDFFRTGKITELNSIMLLSILNKLADLSLKNYIYFYRQQIFSTVDYSYSDLIPENLQSFVNHLYFNDLMVLGNLNYLTPTNTFSYFYDITQYGNNLKKINIINTTCEANGKFSNITFYPEIRFGYKKEKTNKIKLNFDEEQKIAWFNLYLVNDLTQVYNYKTLKNKTSDIIYIKDELNENDYLVFENNDKIILEGTVYLSLEYLQVDWQYLDNNNTWTSFGEKYSAKLFDSYRYNFLNGEDEIVIRVVVTKSNNSNFRIISNTINIKDIALPQIDSL